MSSPVTEQIQVCTHCRQQITPPNTPFVYQGHTYCHRPCASNLGLLSEVERDTAKWGGHSPTGPKPT